MTEERRDSTRITRRDFLKGAGAGVAGAALLAGAGCGAVQDVERRVVGVLPERIRALGRPDANVVLIISDSLRKDHIGVYGNDWIQTPSLDALASESLRFTRAYPESIPSIPARRSMHTGIRTWPFRDWNSPYRDDVQVYGWQPIPAEQTTLAEILRDSGAATALVTDTLHMFRPFYDFHRGFESFQFIRGQERDLYRPAALCPEEKLNEVLLDGPKASHATDIMRQYLANTVNTTAGREGFTPQVFGTAMETLEALAGDERPFFLVVDNYDPHEPWNPPEEYVALYEDRFGNYQGKEPMIASSGPSDWLTKAQLDRMKNLYAAEVTMMDRWVGNFLDRLDELKLTEDTLVIFASDHGHAFGEHGYAGKDAAAMYPELTDVPLMIRDPEGRRAGKTSDYFASTHDIPSTILGFLGVGITSEMEGTDLTPILDGESPEAERRYFTNGYQQYAWTRDERYVMFCNSDGSDAHLFDAEEDPEQRNDLASDKPDLVKKMYDEYIIADAGGEPPPSY